MTWKFSENVSGIGSVLELIFIYFKMKMNEFPFSKTPGNRNKIVWKTWKSQGILFWNVRGHPDIYYEVYIISVYYEE